MESIPSSKEELKNIVCSNSRIKFVSKILHCLRFTMQNPAFVEEIGCSWCPDGVSFIINAGILGEFLQLKPNSINTNFREHGFQLQKSENIKNEFPNLTKGKWKKRIATTGSFNRNSSISDADSIQLIENTKKATSSEPAPQQSFKSIFQTKTKQPENPAPAIKSDFPPKLEEIFNMGDSLHQQISIQHMLLETPMEISEKKTLLTIVTDYWLGHFGKTLSVPVRLALDRLIPRSNQIPDSMIYYMRINFLNLIFQDPSVSSQTTSQINSSLSFEQFLRFYIRYGHPSYCSFLYQITTVPDSLQADDYDAIFNESDYEDPPSFTPGFYPHMRKNDALSLIWTQTAHSWVVIHSKTANKLVLYSKTHDQILQLYISINIISTDPQKIFLVKFKEETCGYPDWLSLLHALALSTDKGLVIQPMRNPRIQVVKDAGADQFGESETSVHNTPMNSQTFGYDMGYQTDSQFSISNEISSFSQWSQTFGEY